MPDSLQREAVPGNELSCLCKARRIGANSVSGCVCVWRLVQRAGATAQKVHLLGSWTPLNIFWTAG